MPEVVMVSSVEKMETLTRYLEEQFQKKGYSEITQAIGMHSLLIDPQHTMKDQAGLYRLVLNMIKDRISKSKDYGAWYKAFPLLMDAIISSKQIVTNNAAADVIASHHEAYGAFKSVDDFYFWALDDRRLALDQIVKYIEKTVEMLKG